MGCVVTWVTLVPSLRGSLSCVGQMFTWAAWVTWVNIFMGHNFYVSCMGQNFFAWVSFFYVSKSFLRVLNFGVSLFKGNGKFGILLVKIFSLKQKPNKITVL